MAKKVKKYFSFSFVQSFLYVVISIALAFILVQIPVFHRAIAQLGTYGYAGALLAGILFVSVFTVAPGVLLLMILAQAQAILPLAIFAGIGAVIGDCIIGACLFPQVKHEIKQRSKTKGIMQIIRLLRYSKYRFLLTILGAAIIASPLPDELGLFFIGFCDRNRLLYLLLAFFLNTAGIYLLLSIVK